MKTKQTKSERALENANGWRWDAERYLGSRKEMRIKKAERMERIARESNE